MQNTKESFLRDFPIARDEVGAAASGGDSLRLLFKNQGAFACFMVQCVVVMRYIPTFQVVGNNTAI